MKKLLIISLLIMGQTKFNNERDSAKYQLSSIFNASHQQHTIIDTQTGEIISRIRDHSKSFKSIHE